MECVDKIPALSINIPKRKDRLEHVALMFKEKTEFQHNVFRAIEDPIGAIGLWKSFRAIIAKAEQEKLDCILLCEDDHLFTPEYNTIAFLKDVVFAGQIGIQVLLGGVSDFGDIVPISRHIFWVDWFCGTQFMIIYRPIYRDILEYQFLPGDSLDLVLSKLVDLKALIFPFISIQHDFGYSDATAGNNRHGIVDAYFQFTSQRIKKFIKIWEGLSEEIGILT